MNIEIAKIDGCIRQALRVVARADAVIANAQSKKFPYDGINHSTRIFCAILAAQARELAERATKQVGLVLMDAQSDDRAATIEAFFCDSARHVDTSITAMATARLASQDALTKSACDMVGRAERVLEGDERLMASRSPTALSGTSKRFCFPAVLNSRSDCFELKLHGSSDRFAARAAANRVFFAANANKKRF